MTINRRNASPINAPLSRPVASPASSNPPDHMPPTVALQHDVLSDQQPEAIAHNSEPATPTQEPEQ